MSVQHYFKTEEFKAAMACLNELWYSTSFDICKLQVEDEFVKAEQTRTISLDMLDRLDPKKKGRYVFPEVELVLEALIPKPKLEKRAPLEIMKDLADAEIGLSAAAPPPPEGDRAKVHEACVISLVLTSFIILSERHGLGPSLEVFFRSMQLKEDVLGWRRFILVVAPDWPMNTTPHAPVARPDPAQLTRLSMLQADFLESLVLFHDRAPIPDFESVVNLESLEDHQIATHRHPHGGPSWLNYLYGEWDNLWRLGVRMLLGGGELSDAECCSGALDDMIRIINGPPAAHVLVLPGRQVNALGQATNILTHLDLIDMTRAFPIPAEFRYHLL
ncbi:hypothetical protein Dimus_008498 [Dionaea muscipula]